MTLVWHREPGMVEHAHATEAERDACAEQAATDRAQRDAALATCPTTDGLEVTP